MEHLEVCAYLSPKRVLCVEHAEKKELMDMMLELICTSDKVVDPEELKKAVWSREKDMSTGIGEGIAIPHARTKAAQDFVVAFALVKQGMEFEAIDNRPVDIVFMIVATEDQDKKYIKLLSRLMLRMKNTHLVDNLRGCGTAEELYNYLVESK